MEIALTINDHNEAAAADDDNDYEYDEYDCDDDCYDDGDYNTACISNKKKLTLHEITIIINQSGMLYIYFDKLMDKQGFGSLSSESLVFVFPTSCPTIRLSLALADGYLKHSLSLPPQLPPWFMPLSLIDQITMYLSNLGSR